MSYEPTNWKSGDTVTSAKLNKMEQGIANGGALVVHITVDEQGNNTIDHTWQEINDAAPLVFAQNNNGVFDGIAAVADLGGTYAVMFLSDFESQTVYTTDSPNGYPTFHT